MPAGRGPRRGGGGAAWGGGGALAAGDVRRRGPAMAGMSGSAALGLGSPLPCRLDVGRGLPGRGRRITGGGRGDRWLRQAFGQRQQREDDGLGSLLVDGPS